jgi:hypothetical protein
MMQEGTARPSSRMVQAPHSPSSQPRFVPVRCISLRKKSTMVMFTGASASTGSPFRVKWIIFFILRPPYSALIVAMASLMARFV